MKNIFYLNFFEKSDFVEFIFVNILMFQHFFIMDLMIFNICHGLEENYYLNYYQLISFSDNCYVIYYSTNKNYLFVGNNIMI